MASLRSRLDDLPLFAGLTAGEIDSLFELCEVRGLAAAQRLLTEGEHADALWILLEGDVEISKEGKVLAEVGAGAVLGELSLFEATPRRSATITTICPAVALRIPVVPFRKRLLAFDLGALKVVNNIAHQLALRLSALNERLVAGRKGLAVARSELRRAVL